MLALQRAIRREDVMDYPHRPVSERPSAARPARREFFLRPQSPAHRRYEALRAYLAEGLPAAEAVARSGYTPASLLSAARDFRGGAREFFVTARPGPKTAPAKTPPGRGSSSCAPPGTRSTRSPERWPPRARR
jgi:hypothetical protein